MPSGSQRDTGVESIPVGRILSAHGLDGWLTIRSATAPRTAILDYQPWLVGPQHRVMQIRAAQVHGEYVRAALQGVSDRTGAEALAGQQIAVRRGQLPEPPPGRFYWVDLLGSRVTTVHGDVLGTVTGLIETGAHDVMQVQGERAHLVPFVMGRYVHQVDLDARSIVVDWDAEF